MRAWTALILWPLAVSAETPAGRLWSELSAKREALPGYHQEFDATHTYRGRNGTQSAKQQVTIDAGGGKWREAAATGSGGRIRVFNGEDLLSMEETGGEFTRSRPKGKGSAPQPAVYTFEHADWAKATELERRPCDTRGPAHTCVLLKANMKPWAAPVSQSPRKMVGGTVHVLVDMETGLVLLRRTVQNFETSGDGYQQDVSYSLRRFGVGPVADKTLFEVPAGAREVKTLSRWDAARIRKDLGGKAAPELEVTDIAGKPVSLAALKGRTVLLDFWTTWCGPCRADAPALDRLQTRYGDKDLAIVGISVSEERKVVAAYLAKHPHGYPIVLTTENEMPGAYQVAVFPTYIVIDREGKVVTALEGDRGFAELKKVLKKAGLESE